VQADIAQFLIGQTINLIGSFMQITRELETVYECGKPRGFRNFVCDALGHIGLLMCVLGALVSLLFCRFDNLEMVTNLH